MDKFRKILEHLFSEKQRETIRYWLKSIPAFFFRKNLSRLAQLYGTDKAAHGYTEIYQEYFHVLRNKKLRILEIGIGGGENIKYGGNSLKMWAKYFPMGEILGIDLYDKSLLDYRRIKTYRGNQTDEIFLSQFQSLDIVIDDGGHVNQDVIKSFEVLFPRVNIGGYYCVEDTHVSGVDEFLIPSHPDTITYFMQLRLENCETFFHQNLIVIRKIN